MKKRLKFNIDLIYIDLGKFWLYCKPIRKKTNDIPVTDFARYFSKSPLQRDNCLKNWEAITFFYTESAEQLNFLILCGLLSVTAVLMLLLAFVSEMWKEGFTGC